LVGDEMHFYLYLYLHLHRSLCHRLAWGYAMGYPVDH